MPRPRNSDAMKSARKIALTTFATPATVPTIPAKPNKAASTAIIKKARVQLNIVNPFQSLWAGGTRALFYHDDKTVPLAPLDHEWKSRRTEHILSASFCFHCRLHCV